jgi:hypothetical protein
MKKCPRKRKKAINKEREDKREEKERVDRRMCEKDERKGVGVGQLKE